MEQGPEVALGSRRLSSARTSWSKASVTRHQTRKAGAPDRGRPLLLLSATPWGTRITCSR